MPTARLTEAEARHVETVKLWLDSMRDWFALSVEGDPDEPFTLSPDAPPWLRVAAGKLNRSIFAPVHTALPEPVLTPYRAGYALGLMRSGARAFTPKAPREVRVAVKKIRLAKKARREVQRLWRDFLIDMQVLARRRGRVTFAYAPEVQRLVRLSQKYRGADESQFHRGLADGLLGLGTHNPADRSTDATDVYLLLVVWWRFVVRFHSVPELHRWLTRILGPARAGSQKRTEKICQRIGLKFRAAGRPRKIPTPPLPA